MEELVIESTLHAARAAEDAILGKIEEHGYPPDALFAIRLSLEEAITNAVKHGNHCDPARRVHLRFSVDDEQAVIYVADDGGGFDPARVPDPTMPNRLSLPNGRGIMLMRAYMDDVQYNRQGNEVRLVKKRT